MVIARFLKIGLDVEVVRAHRHTHTEHAILTSLRISILRTKVG